MKVLSENFQNSKGLIVENKSIETNNYAVTSSDLGIGFLALENGQISKIDKKFRKPQKNCRFY